MPAKLNHYWTINPHKFDEYCKFMIDDFIPAINKLDMHVVSGWSVLVGAYSEIILETVANDLELLEKALCSEKYKDIKARLMSYISSYKTKILVLSGKKDAYTIVFQDNSIKFNQMWDICGDKEDYNRFVEEEFYPCMEAHGVSVAAEWEVLVGDSPQIICEGRANDIEKLIGDLQSKEFRRFKRELKKYVNNYQSRILSFHIQKIKGFKSVNYNIIMD